MTERWTPVTRTALRRWYDSPALYGIYAASSVVGGEANSVSGLGDEDAEFEYDADGDNDGDEPFDASAYEVLDVEEADVPARVRRAASALRRRGAA